MSRRPGEKPEIQDVVFSKGKTLQRWKRVERRYSAGNVWKGIFLSHLQLGGGIKSEDLAIYDFRI